MGLTANTRKPSKMSRVKRRLRSRGSLVPFAVLTAIFLTVAVPVYKLYNKLYPADRRLPALNDDDNDVELLPLQRDLFRQEEWPGVEWNYSEPTQVHYAVHYLWCGQKAFRFQDYLSVLSILRVIQPLKLVFHFTHLPVVDEFWYNTWFQELKQSVPNLVLKPLTSRHPCGSVDMLRVALGLLASDGGIFVGEGVVLTKSINHLKFLPFWFAFSDPSKSRTSGIVFVNRGFNEHTLENYVQVITANAPHCISTDDYDQRELAEENYSLCVSLTEDMYPRDIRSADTPFAELARWLFYGRRSPFFTLHNGLLDPIPRISHYTWMSSDHQQDSDDFQFAHFLSVMSALHVAGVQHVYVHGDVEPTGRWWTELRTENVTFVTLQTPETVFQQPVHRTAHASFIVRYNVLYKYGGVYQDWDVVWVNEIPDWLLGYPAVVSPQWPRYGDWPDTLNLGVLLARRHAPFLRHFLSTYRYFREGDLNWNAVLMPYRTYEWYPDTLYLDRHLQAICSHGTCHSTWADDYNRRTTVDSDNYPSQAAPVFSLDEVRAVHFRAPRIPEALARPSAILNTTSPTFAHIGRYVLQRSGRTDLLEG